MQTSNLTRKMQVTIIALFVTSSKFTHLFLIYFKKYITELYIISEEEHEFTQI